MIELCYEYLSVQCIWLYVIIMSRMCFRMNLHSIVAWMLKNSLVETGAISDILSKEFIDIQAIIECRFTLKCICDMIITCMQCTIISKLMTYVEVHFRLVLRNVSEKLKERCGWISILVILQVIACSFIGNVFHE